MGYKSLRVLSLPDVILEAIEAGIRRVMSESALRQELSGWDRLVLIKVGGDYYTIRVENSVISARREKVRGADVEIRLDEATFREVASGRLSFTTAYLRGRLVVKGDVQASDITRLQKLL